MLETPAERALYVPEVRLRRSRLGPISPPTAPAAVRFVTTEQFTLQGERSRAISELGAQATILLATCRISREVPG